MALFLFSLLVVHLLQSFFKLYNIEGYCGLLFNLKENKYSLCFCRVIPLSVVRKITSETRNLTIRKISNSFFPVPPHQSQNIASPYTNQGTFLRQPPQIIIQSLHILTFEAVEQSLQPQCRIKYLGVPRKKS